jgi:hypothetical protein
LMIEMGQWIRTRGHDQEGTKGGTPPESGAR